MQQESPPLPHTYVCTLTLTVNGSMITVFFGYLWSQVAYCLICISGVGLTRLCTCWS